MISMIWKTHGRAAVAGVLLCALPGAAAAQDSQDPFGGAITATDVSGQVKRPVGRKQQEDEIQVRYRKILAAWAAGETVRAAIDLMALETSVVSDEDPGSRKRLLKAQQAIIHEVGASNLETLVPIAMLHHEAYRRYLLREDARGHALVLSHARSMTRDLAILYREQSGSQGAALVSSRILTSLGGMLQGAAQQLPAADMFQLAAEMDPHNTAALIGLATVFEKNARYEPAVDTLRRLLKADPAHAEGKLRLAVNLHRLEKTGEALPLLQELAASKSEDWIVSLAAQELAALHREAGKLEPARKVLEDAIERIPGDPRLYLQLASVLDRAGQARSAQDLMDKVMEMKQQPSATAARFLYNTIREETFQAARRFLDENAQSRFSVLAQALDMPNKASVGAVGVAG